MEYFKLEHEATMEDIKTFNFPNQKLGVIIHIENEEGKILLQQRGVKSRDENGLYEDVGGKIEDTDINFKEAIIRELKEEIGDEANIIIDNSIGIYHCPKNDINWVFIIYYGKYIDGDIKIMEPEKCMGYNFFSYEDAINSKMVSESCRVLIRNIKENY